MKAFLHITTPAGHVYELPTEPIAQHRAKAMLELHKDEFADIEAALADTRELFDDSYQIKDWASNNMNWSDLSDAARLIRYTPPGDGDLWFNGEFSYHDHQAMMGELDGATLMKQPVELVLNTMALSQQLCNVTVLNGPDGAPYAALALIIGNQPIIGSYVTALQFVGNQITGGVQAAPVAPIQ